MHIIALYHLLNQNSVTEENICKKSNYGHKSNLTATDDVSLESKQCLLACKHCLPALFVKFTCAAGC